MTSEVNFKQKCLETFYYQYQNVPVYKKFVDYLKTDISSVNEIEKIPFLPIEMFKFHKIMDENKNTDFFFQSSGTTLLQRSRHYIADPELYKTSIIKSFEHFLGPAENYIFLGLLPNYSENSHSSLIFMVDYLMQKSNQPENGYFLYNHQALLDLLNQLARQKKKVLLFGVSFALLDFLDFISDQNLTLESSIDFTVIETGGMKGRKKEMTKENLLKILQKGFKTSRIFSEYSMTELLSQAYSLGDNLYESPAWMRVLIRNLEDPFSYEPCGKTGALNIIDLANLHSCSFIATQDLGKLIENPTNNKLKFQVLGRIDHSDIRGCSLLIS